MMSAFIVICAFAAQTAGGSAPPPVTGEAGEGPKLGQTTYLDLEGGAGYSTNPQFSLGSNTGSAFGRVALHAVHARISARSTTLLSAYASNDTYANHYGSRQSLSFDARHDTAVNEHLRLFGDLLASYDEGGQLDTRIVGTPDVPPLPGAPNTPPALLPPSSDFLSVTGRYYRFAGHAGGQLALSAHDSLTLTSGLERSVFRSGRTADTSYWSVPASVAYDRQISARATVGGRVVYQSTNYNGPADFHVITPQLTTQLQLSETLSFGGAVGASFASIDDGIRTRHSNGLSAEATLCNRGELSQFCARAIANQQTATTAGPAKSVGAGIDYSRRLDIGSTIQLSLDATHYSSPTSIISGTDFSSSTYYRAAAAYTRNIGRRLFGGLNVAARKLTQNGPDPKADLSGSLFVRYRFGDLQ